MGIHSQIESLDCILQQAMLLFREQPPRTIST